MESENTEHRGEHISSPFKCVTQNGSLFEPCLNLVLTYKLLAIGFQRNILIRNLRDFKNLEGFAPKIFLENYGLR
ncbi:hypothetical protein BGP_2436 [Beggiatoa sp. PS]|nr:hypothetical protein BGP_2436 [Beggiatoa sp. PS]